ncbi:MAG: ATP-binding protein [Bacteroidia bacterium]|nr:ATP-binding protein [Bacteroidia bacterium]
MKSVIDRLPILFLLVSFGFFNSTKGDNSVIQIRQSWQNYYKKATVATFYSSTVLNGFDELKVANLYLDSSRQVLELYPLLKDSFSEEFQKIAALQSELDGSKLIAEDNLNYIYPPYSLMMGKRPEFNEIDDAEELLVENLLEKVLNLNDPINKGNIRDNADFVLLGVFPFDKNLFLVSNDYFSNETGHYAIRYHEVSNILDSIGFERFKNNELLPKDLEAFCRAYNITKILYLQVLDQGSVIPKLFYKGVYLKTYTKGSNKIEFVNYYEGFRIDKSDSWSMALIILILNLIITALILFFKLTISIKKMKGEVSFIKSWRLYFLTSGEKTKATFLLLLSGCFGGVLTYLVTSNFPIEINEYYGAPMSKMWVLSQILIPLLTTSIIGYLLLNKFTSIPVNSSTSYSGLIFSAIVCQLSIQSYFEYHSEYFSQSFIHYLILIPGLSMSLISLVIGKAINGMVKGSAIHVYTKILTPLVLLGCVIANWFVLRQLFYFSNITFIGVLFFSVLPLFNESLLFKRNRNLSQDSSNGFSLSNPKTWILKGLKMEGVIERLNDLFINPRVHLESENILLFTGRKNIGKSRLIHEFLKDFNKNNGFLFYADCSKLPIQDEQYHWFVDAMVDSNSYNWFDTKFFNDRSIVTDKLESVVKMASSLGPVDVMNFLANDDSKKSISEITNDFLDTIEDKLRVSDQDGSNNGVILVFDGFDLIGEADYQLILSILENLKIRKKIQGRIKFLLVGDHENGGSVSSNRIEEINELLGHPIPVLEFEIDNLNEWIDELTSSKGVSIFSDSQNFVIDFNLRLHIQSITEFWEKDKIVPGDILEYLENLFNDGFISIDSNKLRLVEVPPENKYALKNHAFKAANEALKTLNTEDKKLLESAAHIGLKFDAKILAEVWETSTLNMINRLTQFEHVFIIDVSEEDNIYKFSEVKIQELLVHDSMQSSSDGQVRQMIIEYQKRIIQTIVAEKDFGEFNVDLLSSSFKRCLRFSKVPYLNNHIELLGYETAMKYANGGDTQRLKNVLEDLHDYNSVPDKKFVIHTIKILAKYAETNQVGQVDFEIRGGYFIESLFKLCQKEFNLKNEDDLNNYLILLKVCLKDSYDLLRNLNSNTQQLDRESIIEDLRTYKGFRGGLLKVLHQIIEGMEVLHSDLELECRFYLCLIDEIVFKSNPLEILPIMLKQGLDNNFHRSSGMIARHLSLKLSDKPDRLLYSYISLNCLLSAPIVLAQVKKAKISEEEIKNSIQRLINNKKLVKEQSIDLNMTISRLRDYYSSEEDWDSTIWLSTLGYELSNNHNDSMGVYLNQLSRAFAFYNLHKYNESQTVYWNLFEYQLKRKQEASDFLYILEGLLYCGNALGDFTRFEDAKNEMYDHLMILSNNLLAQKLSYSPYNRDLALIQLINPNLNKKIFAQNSPQEVNSSKSLSPEKKTDLINVISVFIALASSDENIDDGELFDLNETAVALATALSIPHEIVNKEIKHQLHVHKENSVEWNKEQFKSGFEWILNTKSILFTSSILQLLIGLAYADDEYTKVEQDLIEWAKNRVKTG